MKKILAIMIALCLVSASCVSAFAANGKSDFGIPSFDDVVVDDTDDAEEYTLFDEAMEIIDLIRDVDGAVTDEEILDIADHYYNDTYIEKDVYDEIYRIVENGLHNSNEPSTDAADNIDDIINKITDIINDDSLSIGDKVSKIVDILKVLPEETIERVLNELKAAGVINDDIYSMISDALNGNGSILPGGDTDSPLSGIQGLLSGILGMLGLGGDSDNGSDTPNNTPDNSNSGSDSSSDSSSDNVSADAGNFEGSNAKTGDYAIASVAGIALAAGVALVLTKIKKNDNND